MEMLADLNVLILLVWLTAETIPVLANSLADWEIELRKRDRRE